MLEWSEQYTTYDQSTTTRRNVKNYDGLDVDQRDLAASRYDVWPVITTSWANMNDQPAFKPGQLGSIR